MSVEEHMIRTNTVEEEQQTTILLLGGYGNTGRALARLLVQKSNITSRTTRRKIRRLIIAGRNEERAKEFIHNEFVPRSGGGGGEYGSLHNSIHKKDDNDDDYDDVVCNGTLIGALHMDATETPQSLAVLLQKYSVTLLVVACSSTDCVENLARAALIAKVDFLDIQLSKKKLDRLKQMKTEIEQAGCCFITECGFHPGLPAVLIRHMMHNNTIQSSPASGGGGGGGRRIVSAVVSSVIRLDWSHLETKLSPETMQDFAIEFADFSTLTYKNKSWKEEGFLVPKMIDFITDPFVGKQPCVPMYLEELRDIPELYPDLEETGFYVGSLNWVVDWIISPIVMLSLKLWPTNQGVQRSMGRLLYWGLVTFSRPPYGTLLQVVVQVEDAKLESRNTTTTTTTTTTKVLTISHQDGYALTALPVAANN